MGLLAFFFILAATSTEDKRAELERTRRQLAQARQEIETLAHKEKGVLARVELVDTKIGLTQKLIGELKDAQVEKGNQIDDLRATIGEIEKRKDRLAADLSQRLVNIYQRGRFLELELILSAQSLPDVYRRIFYLRTIAKIDRERFNQYRTIQIELERNKAELDSSYQALSQLRTEREAEEDSLRSAQNDERKTLQKVRTQKKEKEALAEELRQAAQRLENLIGSLETKRTKRRTPPGEHFVERGRGKLTWPYHGSIVSDFGTQAHPKYGTKTRNNGVDIRCPVGVAIKAVAPGRVVFSDRFMGYGKTILIDHGDGYYSVYSYLDEMLVSTGTKVVAGQEIARAGNILHFEFRQNAQPVNPLNWLR